MFTRLVSSPLLASRCSPLLIRSSCTARAGTVRLASSLPYSPDAPMWKRQKEVPAYPIIPLQETADRYLEYVRPLLSGAEYEHTQRVTRRFVGSSGPTLQAELERLAADSAPAYSWLSGFWNTMYQEIRAPLPVGVSPFLAIKDDPTRKDQLVRAASMVHGAGEFYARVQRNELTPDLEGDKPWDMTQYLTVLGTTRVPRPSRDICVTNTKSKHVAVMINDHFYTIDVLDDALSPLDEAVVLEQLTDAHAHASARPPADIPVGMCTGDNRDVWAATRDQWLKDEKNGAAVKAVEDAILVLCLDSEAPQSALEKSKLLLHRDGRQRWWDKFQVVVFKNGAAGAILEHTPVDGHTSLRVWIEYFMSLRSKKPLSEPAKTGKKAKHIEWNLDAVREAVEASTKAMQGLISVTDTDVLLYDTYGKEWIKEKGVSPDSFVQMAIQIAFMKVYGFTASTYESANTKRFLGGRTETIRSVTPESTALTALWTDPSSSSGDKAQAFAVAAQSHGRRVKEGNMARGVDRHLFVLHQLAKHRQQRFMDEEIPELFTDPAFARLTTNVLSTSNVSTPLSDFFGFGAVTGDGIGVAYSVEKGRLCFNLSSYTGYSKEFRAALEETFEEIRGVLDRS
eukprot:TRINITY_DN9049_c0_g1_i1.p1 TRINITY_DN9049_c0_g1~~TRINITY_DN9049_c0_g1_i1.p1  ORF type:complete len:624 (+),score=199.99 TRINITY_DN9049_c0_g1_i1:274-2145(+)